MADEPKLKTIPFHVCDKAPKNGCALINPLVEYCPYCGKKLREKNG